MASNGQAVKAGGCSAPKITPFEGRIVTMEKKVLEFSGGRGYDRCAPEEDPVRAATGEVEERALVRGKGSKDFIEDAMKGKIHHTDLLYTLFLGV